MIMFGRERGGENYWYGYSELCMDKDMCKNQSAGLPQLPRSAKMEAPPPHPHTHTKELEIPCMLNAILVLEDSVSMCL